MICFLYLFSCPQHQDNSTAFLRIKAKPFIKRPQIMVAYSSLTYQESHAPCDHLENQGFSVVGTSDCNVYVNQLGILLKMTFLVQGTGIGPEFLPF